MFTDTFIQLLSDYPEGLKDKRRFAALLRDHFPEDIMYANLIYTAYGMDLPAEIERVSGITNAFAFRYVKRLMEEYGVSRANADWTVAVWCVCYGGQILGKPCDISLPTGQEAKTPIIQEDAKLNGQYESLFTYAKVDDGCGIRSFTGANKRTIIFPNVHNGLPVREILPSSFSGTEVEEIVMTNSVKRIGDHAFSDCSQLKQAILSPALEEIGAYAFENCGKLTTVSLPPTLQYIGKFAFKGTGIKAPILSDALWELGEGAFQDCKLLTKTHLPEGIEIVAKKLFMGCTRLAEIVLPNSIECIEEDAFRGCSGLDRLAIPVQVKTIGEHAFADTAPKFTLLVSRGSAAEQYARKHGFRFQIVY